MATGGSRLYVCVCVAAFLAGIVVGQCPNLCSGHGDCGLDKRCSCWRADKLHDTYYIGGDCSLRECPKGVAWVDVAFGPDTSHGLAECSNAGTCNRATGECKCLKVGEYPLFEGVACERMRCPNDCNGHGTCQSMNQIAKTHGGSYDYAGHIRWRYDNWDAEKLWGCKCDRGYFGYDCSLRKCPSGDDPLTPGAPEIQSVTCEGIQKIQLGFRDEYTDWLKAGSTELEIKNALMLLDSVDDVEVNFEMKGENSCSTKNPPQNMLITFYNPGGDLPLLTMNGQGNLISIFEFQKGSTEQLDCAGRGNCDPIEGLCTCNYMFASSDGHGKTGTRGDCGFLDDTPFPVGFQLHGMAVERSPKMRLTGCPTSTDGIDCSGHGVCAGTPTWQCSCSEGWKSGDCSLRTCPFGHAWVDTPTRNNFAHGFSECSNMGICDREKGTCDCRVGFTGGACERLNCPKGDGVLCAGHGECITMRELALGAKKNGNPTPFQYGSDQNNGNTWDADHILGCSCDSGWKGIGCREKTCPYGDDPRTEGVHEVQVFKCTFGSNSPSPSPNKVPDSTSKQSGNMQSIIAPQAGQPITVRKPAANTPYFTLVFRGETTPPIYPHDTVFALQKKLEYISTIGAVDVTLKHASTVCDSSGVVVAVEFLTEDGGGKNIDMFHRVLSESPPPMTLGVASNGVSIQFAEDEAGHTIGGVKNVNATTENSLCSDRGLCDTLLGQCVCFPTYTSATDRGNKGTCDRLGKYLWIDPNRL